MSETYLLKVGEEDVPRMDAMSQIYNPGSLDWIDSELDKVKTFLDVGCGNGGLTIELAKKYPDITFVGMDISHEQLDLARTRGQGIENLSFVTCDVKELSPMIINFPNKFDIVHCRFVLTHQSNPAELAKNLLELVEYGGKLLVQETGGRFDIVTYPSGEQAPKSILAWKMATEVMHRLQHSHLNAADLIGEYFRVQVHLDKGLIDTNEKKTLFVEGVKLAVEKIEQFKNDSKELPDQLNPMVKFEYSGEDWISEIEHIQQDDSQFEMLGSCHLTIQN